MHLFLSVAKISVPRKGNKTSFPILRCQFPEHALDRPHRRPRPTSPSTILPRPRSPVLEAVEDHDISPARSCVARYSHLARRTSHDLAHQPCAILRCQVLAHQTPPVILRCQDIARRPRCSPVLEAVEDHRVSSAILRFLPSFPKSRRL